MSLEKPVDAPDLTNPFYKNFEGVVNEVLNYGFNDGPQVNRKRIEAWVNEAQNQIALEVEAPEWQRQASMALVKGTYQYELPEGFTRMESVYAPAMQVRLRPVDQHEFDRNSPIVEGPPLLYLVRENSLWLYPTPISTEGTGTEEGLKLRYYRRPEWLEAGSSKPELNPRYWHLLVEYALVRAFAAEDDSEQSQFHETEFKRMLDLYATDVQRRDVDGPRSIAGTWGSGTYGQGGWY